MEKATTVRRLMELCAEQIRRGNGEKQILMSGDDEGNSFHELFFGFTYEEEDVAGLWDLADPWVRRMGKPEDYVVLG